MTARLLYIRFSDSVMALVVPAKIRSVSGSIKLPVATLTGSFANPEVGVAPETWGSVTSICVREICGPTWASKVLSARATGFPELAPASRNAWATLWSQSVTRLLCSLRVFRPLIAGEISRVPKEVSRAESKAVKASLIALYSLMCVLVSSLQRITYTSKLSGIAEEVPDPELGAGGAGAATLEGATGLAGAPS